MKGKIIVRTIGLLIFIVILTGCVSVQVTDYIKDNHPYTRKIIGDYENIIDTVKVVLFKEGWQIQAIANPSVYERRVGGEDESKDVLFLTGVKQYPKILYSTYTHLNVIVCAVAEGADVEIRYEALTPVRIKQFRDVRNDKLANRLLDNIEKELENK